MLESMSKTMLKTELLGSGTAVSRITLEWELLR